MEIEIIPLKLKLIKNSLKFMFGQEYTIKYV